MNPMYADPSMSSSMMMQSEMNRNNMNFRLGQIEHEVMAHKAQQAMMTNMNRSGSAPFLQPVTPTAAPSKEHQDLLGAHHQLLSNYMDLMQKHTDLMDQYRGRIAKEEAKLYTPILQRTGGKDSLRKAACLGIIRLDYDYPPAPGDIDCPESYDYDVHYRVVPGLTFDICQSGKIPQDIKEEIIEAIRYLEKRGVQGITGDCGFMMYFQGLARQHTKKPVFMSSLAQLPAVTCGFAKDELIALFTANSETLTPMKELIKAECGVDAHTHRFVIVGCQDVPGFEAVAAGGKVDTKKVTPGMVQIAKDTLRKYPHLRAFLFECTELPPYSDAVRAATGLPVYDSITACNFFMAGLQDNKRFGLNDWQEAWDQQQDTYKFGSNLSAAQRAKLVNK